MSKKRPKNQPDAGKAEASPTPRRLDLWLKNYPRTIAAVLVAIACIRIAATYPVFNHTVDEPVHIAAGMEWLDKGVYRYEAQHPPLARVMSAIGPYLLGIRSQGKEAQQEGTGILYSGGHYERNLAASRLGILPFFIIAAITVYVWANWAFGPPIAVMAVLLFTSLPAVLAHAGLSTTDMALTAFLGAAFLASHLWAERPSLKRSAVLGATVALATLSKLSFAAFFPVCVIATLVCYFAINRAAIRQRLRALSANLFPYARGLAVAAAVAFLIIWAGYRFSFGKSLFVGISVPAPELFAGIQDVIKHNKGGHPTYLLGERSPSGFWYYYPVVLAVKTPLAFLGLLFAGIIVCARRKLAGRWFPPLAFAAGILLVGLFSRINIGLRHILPVYIALSIVAAAGLAHLTDIARKAAWAKAAAGLLTLWLVAGPALAHPDYLPYFNALAGSEPEQILADSDLDWGQDVKRLSQRLRELGAKEVTLLPFIWAEYEKEHGFPKLMPVDPGMPSPGWNAVSITVWKVARMGLQESYPEITVWPDYIRVKPRERVGNSFLLWYFPPAQTVGTTLPAPGIPRGNE